MAVNLRYIVPILCGIVFGFCLEKGRVFEPYTIRYQMVFHRFIMLKMFLGAVFSGLFCMWLLRALPWTRNKLLAAHQSYLSGIGNKGIFAVVCGTFILGVGMTLCGACPGTVLAQIGAGTPNAIFTYLGGLCGALFYGLFEPMIRNIFDRKTPMDRSKMNFSTLLGIPAILVTVIMAAMLGTLLYQLEKYFPWQSELMMPNSSYTSLLKMRAWPPVLVGLVIGTLQVPLILGVSKAMGSSSSYCTIAAFPLCTKELQSQFVYLARKRSGIENWWQVIYVVSAMVGAAISSRLSGSYGSTQGVSNGIALAGGFLIIFGARLASGCTSGHGLSGVSLLVPLSLVGVAAMFGGAMVAAHFLNNWNELANLRAVF